MGRIWFRVWIDTNFVVDGRAKGSLRTVHFFPVSVGLITFFVLTNKNFLQLQSGKENYCFRASGGLSRVIFCFLRQIRGTSSFQVTEKWDCICFLTTHEIVPLKRISSWWAGLSQKLLRNWVVSVSKMSPRRFAEVSSRLCKPFSVYGCCALSDRLGSHLFSHWEYN